MINYPTTQNVLTEQLADRMFRDRKVRQAITRDSHLLFFHFYFAHYVTCQTAPFHFELFKYTEDESIKNLVVVAFRGSGKSTLMTMSYPLWAILGRQRKKFVLILCQTRSQAKQHMMNVKRELEGNILLKNDLGPFQEENDEWGATSLVFSRLNARITAASTEQSIRGLRHHQHRPDVIIGDDLEDLASTRTHEARQKTYDWLMGEAIPAGSRQTRLILIGNFLHEDALLPRMKRQIDAGNIKGVFRAYPLVRDDGAISWPGMYPTHESIEELRRKEGEQAFLREYQLKIIPEDDQVIFPEWIHYHDTIPPPPLHANCFLATGIDLASSDKDKASYTAMVTVRAVIEENGHMAVYILPHPVNKRLSFPEQVDEIKRIHAMYGSENLEHYLFIEQVGYQKSLVDELVKQGYSAEGVIPRGSKRERLIYISEHIRNKVVLFPRHGAEDLITQLVHFGVERYDDLADATSLLINKIMENKKEYKPLPRFDLRVSDFYNSRIYSSTDWAEREDQGMLGRINGRPSRWRRIFG